MQENEEIVPMALQPRKKQVKSPQSLPEDFKKKVAELFNRQFATVRDETSFAIYGGMYPNELLLCTCFSEVGKIRAVSFYVSIDLKENIAQKPEQVTELLKSAVDLTASWFAQVFDEAKQKHKKTKFSALEEIVDMSKDFISDWQETTWEKKKFFVLINNENQVLESATDRFLNEG